MDQPQPNDNTLEPFQIARERRRNRRRARAEASSSEDDEAKSQSEAEAKAIWDEAVQDGAAGRKKRRGRRKGSGRGPRGPRQVNIPEHVSRMLGQANLMYAMPNMHEEAERLLMEVVRQVPNLAEPYFTLGALHDSAGNIRKALSFYMIAAHMSSKRAHDAHLWHKLA